MNDFIKNNSTLTVVLIAALCVLIYLLIKPSENDSALKDARKEIAALNKANAVIKDSIIYLKKVIRIDSVKMIALKDGLRTTEHTIIRQKGQIKIINSKYEKINVIDNATDAELYERLSNTAINVKAASH